MAIATAMTGATIGAAIVVTMTAGTMATAGMAAMIADRRRLA